MAAKKYLRSLRTDEPQTSKTENKLTVYMLELAWGGRKFVAGDVTRPEDLPKIATASLN